MAEIPLPVSKAREELVSWRQSAYEARREAAIKIQRWYREGYRIAASCVNPESPSEAERAAGGRYDIKVTKDESINFMSSSNDQVTSSNSQEGIDNVQPLAEESSFDRYVASELAIALVMSNKTPMSTLNEAQQERVRKLKEGMNIMTASPNQPENITNQHNNQFQSVTQDSSVRRRKEPSKIPVRVSKSKGPSSSDISVTRSKDTKKRVMKPQVILTEEHAKDGESVTKQLPPVKATRCQHPAEHISSNFKKTSQNLSLTSQDSQTSVQKKHLKTHKSQVKTINTKATKTNVKNGDNLLMHAVKAKEELSNTSLSEEIGCGMPGATSTEEQRENYTLLVKSSSTKQMSTKKPLLITNHRPKYLVPLPHKKLVRQKSHHKLKRKLSDASRRQKSRVPVVVDAAVQTDDSDSYSSPSHVQLPLSHSDEWSKPRATLSPCRETGSYSNVYAMKKQQRRKSVIRALQTPQCKPFERKKASGYLQKYNKNNKDTSSLNKYFSPVYMENSISLLTMPQDNPLPDITRLAGLHNQAGLLAALRHSYGTWTEDRMSHSLEINNYQRSWGNTSVPSHMTFRRREKRT